jgi:hypothetical protein
MDKQTICDNYRKEIKTLENKILEYVSDIPLTNYSLMLRGRNIALAMDTLKKVKEEFVVKCFQQKN